MEKELEFNLSEKKLLKFKKAWAWPQKVEDYFKEMIKIEFKGKVYELKLKN